MTILSKFKAAFLGDRNGNCLKLLNTYAGTVDDSKLIRKHEAAFLQHSVEWQHFLLNSMLRRCIIATATATVYSSGFDTQLEAPVGLSELEQEAFNKKYMFVKNFVDQVNKQVNMDNKLFAATGISSLYGKAAYEIVCDETGTPIRLKTLPVSSNKEEGLQPIISETSDDLEGFILQKDKSKGQKPITYRKDEVLYFLNNDVNEEYQGISDVAPVIIDCINIACLKRQIPSIINRVFNPFTVASVDTSDKIVTPENQVEVNDSLKAQMKKLLDGYNSGSNIVTNNKVQTEMIQLKIVLPEVAEFEVSIENKIIATFGVPRFLVNRPDVNRATATAEFEAFIKLTVASKQRYLKRVLESEVWYDRLVRLALGLGPEEVLPVRIKHVWRVTDTGNLKEKVDAANILYGNGLGIFGEYPELALELAGIINAKAQQCLTLPKSDQTVE